MDLSVSFNKYLIGCLFLVINGTLSNSVNSNELLLSRREKIAFPTQENCDKENARIFNIRLLKSNDNTGWKDAFYTVKSFRSEQDINSASRNLLGEKTNTFLGNGKVEDHSLCLQNNAYYSFELSKSIKLNQNEEIGAFICGKFLSTGDLINFQTLSSGKCSIFVKGEQRTSLVMDGRGLYSMSYSYSYNPTHKPTHVPTTKPTTFIPLREEQCLSTCPSYSATWIQTDYCNFYTSSSCSVSAVSTATCIPTCLQSSLCASAYCDKFAVLSYICENPSQFTYPVSDALGTECIKSFIQKSNIVESVLSFSMSLQLSGMIVLT
jgi:hypothetical protein